MKPSPTAQWFAVAPGGHDFEPIDALPDGIELVDGIRVQGSPLAYSPIFVSRHGKLWCWRSKYEPAYSRQDRCFAQRFEDVMSANTTENENA